MSKLPLPENEKKAPANFLRTKGLQFVVAMTVVNVLAALALGIANEITAPIIATTEHERLMDMLEKVMPEADEYKKVVTDNGKDIYFGVKNREVLAAAIPGEGKGFYGEPVELLAIIKPSGEIEEVVVVRHKETPGLGDKISEPTFLSQFEGMTDSSLFTSKEDYEELLIAEVDIISGATISSEAVVEGVAQAITLYTALPSVEE